MSKLQGLRPGSRRCAAGTANEPFLMAAVVLLPNVAAWQGMQWRLPCSTVHAAA